MGAIIKRGKIEGVRIQDLRQIRDDRGAVMHMMRKDSPFFGGFGEIYFSVINPGVVKGWKKHRLMVQNFCVPCGEIQLVIFDDRQGSLTKGECLEIEVGLNKYSLIQIPPGLWYSFRGVSEEPAMLANCATHPHDPEEVEILPLHHEAIPFKWPL